jgi:transposase
MPKFREVRLTEEAQTELTTGWRDGSTHAFRRRCHAILLKSQGQSAAAIATLLNVKILSVFNWLNRYDELGIAGLQTRTRSGPERILTEADAERVKAAVQADCQRLSVVKANLEKELNRSFSLATLKRFLKVISQDTNAFVVVPPTRRMKRSRLTKPTPSAT